jgi:homoserine kinase type II
MKIDLNGVLSYYDLGDPLRARPAERGCVNVGWVIETTSGRCFLKRYHPSLRNASVIHAQHALVEYLRRSGFPAPAVLATITGDTLLMLNSEFYEMQEHIEGGYYDRQLPAHLREAALVLGRYHTLTAGFRTLALRQGDLYGPVFLRRNLGKLVTTWGLEYNPIFRSSIRKLASHTDDLETAFTSHGALPHLAIHGDYYADNLLFRDDRIVGVLDYDKARWQPRVVELAEALIYFASPEPATLRHIVYPGPLEWERVERFLRSYANKVELSQNETRALPDYIRCIWLQVSLQRLQEQSSRPAEAAEALHEVVVLGEWAAANAAKIVDMIEETVRDA